MTCIVGIVDGKRVIIGADSAGVAGLDVTIRKDAKAFKVGEFVMGGTSSFRMIQLLRFSFKPPEVKGDVYKYMCTGFIDEVKNVFAKNGYSKIESNEHTGGVFLVGYKNRLFKVDSDFQVGESTDKYDSCGCGQSFSLGAFAAMPKSMRAIDKVKKALDVAVHFSGGVRPPYTIVST